MTAPMPAWIRPSAASSDRAGLPPCAALREQTVTAVYAGLRPATQFKDYQIEALPDRNWITVGGIRSTGLTGALGIAQHVEGLYRQSISARCGNRTRRQRYPMPNLAEHLPRPYQQPGSGEIVCHCELVTRGEIDAALQGPLPAGDLGGLKRRTRCMMGRCQGFYCSARVFELAQGKLPDVPGQCRGRMTTHDVVIVGGGPAGLSAARRLLGSGVRDVVVLERESEAGGIPRHCGHTASASASISACR